MGKHASVARLEAIYAFEKRIGQGGFGDVWLARDAKSGRQVAVKLISLEKLPRAMVEVEVEAMRRCGSHPYIIELLGVYWVRPEGRAADSGPVEAAIVMELAGGGGLFERLVAEGAYTEQIASKIIKQVALSIYHLHSRGILHRDLKPENVVFECEQRRCAQERDSAIKLIDFGTAVTLDEAGEKVQGGGRIGTWSYWAPEQLAQQPYGFEVDLWSLGVLLYILLVGFHPFDPEGEANEQQILANMKAHRLCLDAPEWGTVSGQAKGLPLANLTTELRCAKGLVVSLLEPDPEQRLTAAQLISHPWVLGQDVPGRPMPATQERLRHFTQARNAFYGSLLMGLLVHQLSTSADAEGLGGLQVGWSTTDAEGWMTRMASVSGGLQVDVVREGWRALDRDGKGHIDAQDLWRVCLDMGYKVSPKDVDQMVCVLAPTGLEKKRYCKTLAGSFSRTFEKGAYEGDPVDAFFVITSGACEERLIATLGAGDFFGETS
ncbi:hypothetical protein EMIHUDRAFT_458993 [Emiliania huxleyi CCMP1516]|uniref:Protein kinase domain-containing protein n=2 Tax=Emiliania huxleyi TaxID=2903 RepID=A0A0D3J1B0_EMIH1|nr:hypothetical protein EMIHUDRAFT_458993 [Emiliania huxleyi CCMP1516]EOD17295.1 hypothetical protein EMIHUDRAFT_458993 [Emiliania huxleyi CCMP1516]|eukprot:XP_005769724.1 hypothetical protein EMIHUDRAFT_458993 [Emiliania huxleyi CCMP1516]